MFNIKQKAHELLSRVRGNKTVVITATLPSPEPVADLVETVSEELELDYSKMSWPEYFKAKTGYNASESWKLGYSCEHRAKLAWAYLTEGKQIQYRDINTMSFKVYTSIKPKDYHKNYSVVDLSKQVVVNIGEPNERTFTAYEPEPDKAVDVEKVGHKEFRRIQFRRDTDVEWSNSNPILSLGEPGYDTVQKMLKIGDGVTPWRSLGSVDDTLFRYTEKLTDKLDKALVRIQKLEKQLAKKK